MKTVQINHPKFDFNYSAVRWANYVHGNALKLRAVRDGYDLKGILAGNGERAVWEQGIGKLVDKVFASLAA